MVSQIKIDDFADLHLRIRTLGYPDEGESIMISLMDKEVELYNIFTDCYAKDEYHYWVQELPPETRINDFIWTHPDRDHSLGIERLLEKFDPDKKAQIFLPTSLTEELLRNNSKTEALSGYQYLKGNYNTNRRYDWNEVSVAGCESIRPMGGLRIINRRNNDSLMFRIGFMLPNGAVVNRRVDKASMNAGEMNDLSLFYIVELNRMRYVFAGDLSGSSLQFLDDEYLSNCRFIKIPHHGSQDPVNLVDKVQPITSARFHAVTTVFGAHHPYDEVLDKYSDKGYEVYCTGRGKSVCGIVEMDYNIADLNKLSVYLTGNALRVRP